MAFAAFLLSVSLAQLPAERAPIRYRIDARLNVKEHVLTGRSRIRYRNTAPVALDEIYLHLDANKYRGPDSIAGREKDFYHDRTIRGLRPDDRGYLDIERLTVDGDVVSFRLLDTVVQVRLPRPLAPTAEVDLDLDWFQKVRRATEGGGRRGRHYDFSLWYPRVAAYGESGWDREPGHDLGDVNGAFADFDVTLTVPRALVVGATGSLRSGDPGWRPRASLAPPRAGPVEAGTPGTHKTVRFLADRVPDFAWVADPDFIAVEEEVAGSTLRVLAAGREPPAVHELLARGAAIWRRLVDTVGPPPYEEVTIAVARGAAAVAHPMVVFLGDGGEADLARGLAHQYFGAAVHSDGVREPWLSRGLSAWWARRDQTARYGPTGVDSGALGWYARRLRLTPARDLAALRVLATARFGRDEPVATVAHRFRDRDNYLPAVDDKASLFIGALEGTLGVQAFGAGLRQYYRLGRHRRTGERALRAALEEASGRDLEALFDSWLRTTAVADYSVRGVAREATDDGQRVTVVTRRRGALEQPVEVLVEDRDGPRRWRRGLVQGDTSEVLDVAGRARLVAVDPGALALDSSRFNNRRPRRVDLVLGWPLQDYRPRDALALSLRPAAWYNIVDGARVGFVLTGALDGVRHRFKIAPSIDTKRGRFDYWLDYATPIRPLGRTELGLRLAKAEGRRHFRAALSSNLSSRHSRRPQSRFEIGFSSMDVSDLSYVRPVQFSGGTTNQLWLEYGGEFAGKGWEGGGFARFQTAGKGIQSDYSFNKLSMAVNVKSERDAVTLKARTFLGLSSDGELLPNQERFYLAGAGPMAQFSNPGLRSRDSLLTLLNYHQPGDGNLRYYNESVPSLSARRLFTINAESSVRLLRDPASSFVRSIGTPSIGLFGDIGNAEGVGVSGLPNLLVGFGFGFRLDRRAFGRDFHFRIDFPVFVNRPGFDADGGREDRAAARWVISFSPAL